MVRISFEDQHYVLLHQPACGGTARTFTFQQDFLPVGIYRRSNLFPSTTTEQLSYHLTSHQEATASTIFRNLHKEDHSDYPYKNELQKTYLIELIHLLYRSVQYPHNNPH